MGCDGGSIPKRKEIVKSAQRRRSREETEQQAAERWALCALSDWTLRQPIVAGQWGHLMNKEAILEHYLELRRDSLSAYRRMEDKGPVLSSFHAMKDVKELKLSDNIVGEHEDAAPSASNESTFRPLFACPVTGLETNGKHKFVFSWNCGCVVSERAIQEISKDKGKCLVCQTPYEEIDLVKINPTKEELKENQAKHLVRELKDKCPDLRARRKGASAGIQKKKPVDDNQEDNEPWYTSSSSDFYSPQASQSRSQTSTRTDCGSRVSEPSSSSKRPSESQMSRSHDTLARQRESSNSHKHSQTPGQNSDSSSERQRERHLASGSKSRDLNHNSSRHREEERHPSQYSSRPSSSREHESRPDKYGEKANRPSKRLASGDPLEHQKRLR